MKKLMLQFRKLVEVNTDPLCRYYNGAYFSSEMVWTPWADLYEVIDENDGTEAVRSFSLINKNSEYRLAEIE